MVEVEVGMRNSYALSNRSPVDPAVTGLGCPAEQRQGVVGKCERRAYAEQSNSEDCARQGETGARLDCPINGLHLDLDLL